jgi:hypothetical protein
MAEKQDWCTQCGKRAGRDPRARATWYSVGILTAGSAVLASGAAAAGVAALTQTSTKEAPRRTLVAQAPATTSPGTSAPTAPVNPGAAETLKVPPAGTASTLPPANTLATPTTTPSSSAAINPPVSVHTTPAPAPSHTHASAASTTHSTSTASNSSSNSSSSSASAEPINLTGVSASVYNPYGYPASAFAHHKRAGEQWEPPNKEEPSTAWTVTVKPGTAEHLNVGLAINLGEAQKLGSVEVATATPGFPLEVRGTASSTPPASITEWTPLRMTRALKRTETLKLGGNAKAFRHLVLWIPSVPERLSHVTISEVTLFEP